MQYECNGEKLTLFSMKSRNFIHTQRTHKQLLENKPLPEFEPNLNFIMSENETQAGMLIKSIKQNEKQDKIKCSAG